MNKSWRRNKNFVDYMYNTVGYSLICAHYLGSVNHWSTWKIENYSVMVKLSPQGFQEPIACQIPLRNYIYIFFFSFHY